MQTEPVTGSAPAFYREALRLMRGSGVRFMVGGAYALAEYADIERDTKDLDVFCTAGDCQRLLHVLAQAGFETSLTDANWIAKAGRGDYFIDLIFNSANGLCPVEDTWFSRTVRTILFGIPIELVPVEDVLHSKAFVQQRIRFDGPDFLHIVRKSGRRIDWKYLLSKMDVQWEILLAHLLTFTYVYPSETDTVPDWLLRDLLGRAMRRFELPPAEQRLCRGPLLSRTDYEIDITGWGYEWGFKQS